MGLGEILRFGGNAVLNGRKMQGSPYQVMPQMGGNFMQPQNSVIPGSFFAPPNDPVGTFNTPGGKVGGGLGSTLRNVGGWAKDHPDTLLNGVGLALAYMGQRRNDKMQEHEMHQRDEDRDREYEERRRRAEAINALMPQIMQGYNG